MGDTPGPVSAPLVSPPVPTPPFALDFWSPLPHGILTSVVLPGTPDPVPEDVLHRLFRDEVAHARTLKGWRQPSWVGGRLAAHHALQHLGTRQGPLLSREDGSIQCPSWLSLSISHKRTLAVALASHSVHGSTVGVDLEDCGEPRMHLAPHILRPEELTAVEELPEDRRWLAVLLRFSMKEAIYKALHPHVQRYIAFDEASIALRVNGTARIDLHLHPPAGRFSIEGRYHWLTRRVVTTVRVVPLTGDAATEEVSSLQVPSDALPTDASDPEIMD